MSPSTTPPFPIPAAAALTTTVVTRAAPLSLRLLPGEAWWGGPATVGRLMPFTTESSFSCDLADPGVDASGAGQPSNQVAPSFVSTCGRVIYSDEPFTFRFDGDHLTLSPSVTASSVTVTHGAAGTGLRDAYRALTAGVMSPDGRMPAPELFTQPQYNTWIEMPYEPTQERVIAYAEEILASGMPPGIIMIDDNWAPAYGTLRFDSGRFPDPAGMCARLHELGFRVMLWIVPFISPDTAAFRDCEAQGYLLRDATGAIAIRRWWNGLSALLDLSNPSALEWLRSELDMLRTEIGVDGFKCDAGDIRDYREDDASSLTPVQMCEAWGSFVSQFPFNELRACWKNAGMPLLQRLEDKPPTWDERGIATLVPNLLAQAMIGHPYTCPDMIGGGEIEAMLSQGAVDQEFFVRYTQVAALAPAMQFSMSPARVLDAQHLAMVRQALELRAATMPVIEELARCAALTGEPIIRPVVYDYPAAPPVTDQFCLGPGIIVAPVVTRGAQSRRVILPQGTWVDDAGQAYTVTATVETLTISAPLERLPVFTRQG